MGTPFIQLQEPFDIHGYDRSKPPGEQPASVLKAFLDAMEVRESVFVQEQGVPLEFELDDDDPRSCHWVIYASVNRIVQREERDEATGEVTRPQRSETRSQPIGTVRLVPFPHPPHPRPGGKYVDNKLTNEGQELPPEAILGGGGDDQPQPQVVQPLTSDERLRSSVAQSFGVDRPTSWHDGQEPYVKLGRLAVVKEFRGHRISNQLISAALKWMREHPAYFNP